MEAGAAFGAHGTPIAVLIGSKGRIGCLRVLPDRARARQELTPTRLGSLVKRLAYAYPWPYPFVTYALGWGGL